jgi:hypothetical protein
VVTVPEHAIAWVAPVVLIPIMTGGLRAWKVRRKMRGTPEKSGD